MRLDCDNVTFLACTFIPRAFKVSMEASLLKLCTVGCCSPYPEWPEVEPVDFTRGPLFSRDEIINITLAG